MVCWERRKGIPFQGYVPFLHALHVESYRWDGTGLELESWGEAEKAAASIRAWLTQS
jgi:hypothetical protein